MLQESHGGLVQIRGLVGLFNATYADSTATEGEMKRQKRTFRCQQEESAAQIEGWQV